MRKMLLFVPFVLAVSLNIQASTLSSKQQEEVKELIRETLVENPEILVESLNELRKKEQAMQQDADKIVLKELESDLFKNPDNPVIGDPEAPLAIVYFGDYNCSYCKKQDPVLMKIVKDNPKVKVIVKELPVLGPDSVRAAEYALATHKADREKYLPVFKRLMSKPGKHSSESIVAALKAEGVDVEKLKIDQSITKQISDNRELAQKLGLRGTPALVFPDEVLRGFVDEEALKQMIDERLRQK